MTKKKILLFFTILNLTISLGFTQDFDVVPKIKTIEAGLRYIGNSSLDVPSTAWGAQFDVMWQVSGFKEKRPSFISIPIGYTQIPGTNSGYLLYYGWTIKHNLARDKKWIPVLSYNLLMNQLWFNVGDGRVMGHETRFDFAYEYHPDEASHFYYLKLEYSHMTFPAIGQKKSDRLEVISAKLGFGF